VYHQRQCDARRLATRWSYAHGIGALAGMLGRRGDRLGARMMTASVRGALVRLIRAVGGLDRSGVHQALLTFTGLVRGALYGCRLAAEPSRGQLREPHVSTESGQ
jgi:hypothetical protein